MRPLDNETGDVPHMSSALVSPRATLAGFGALAVILGIGLTLAVDFAARPGGETQVAAAGAAENHFKDISLVAKSAIVVDIAERKVLYAKNPDVQLPLASLTKVPLALVASEVLPPDSMLTLPRNMFQVGYPDQLLQGERWRVRDVLDFTLAASSNEGADILAGVAGESLRAKYRDASSESPALWRMNDLAEKLGLSATHFLNVTGLDVSTTLAGAYGSARDMALLFAYAAETNPEAFSATTRGDVTLTSQSGLRVNVHNTNLLEREIPGLILGKTGFTDLAGGNLAVVFDVGIARPVVAVVLGSTPTERFNDIQKLVEAARNTIASE
ncbi:D-alanyl-D-alanine carboxypeptidase [Candidatus Parcubacteria bacterium]|nr:MAG: D-alanyl-D-alanine carboxypeptidase [Candidatus Parcubacteria bacterium]